MIGELVMDVDCAEPGGLVNRKVRFMPLTIDNLKRLWTESSKFNSLFSEEIRGDFKKFLELFVHSVGEEIDTNGLFWVVDDFVGVFYMTEIKPGVSASVHYSFFDRRHEGRQELAREMLKFAFARYQFRRMTAEIPLYATKQAHLFIESLGFVREGRKRKAAFYKGEWFDVNVFGILREEV